MFYVLQLTIQVHARTSKHPRIIHSLPSWKICSKNSWDELSEKSMHVFNFDVGPISSGFIVHFSSFRLHKEHLQSKPQCWKQDLPTPLSSSLVLLSPRPAKSNCLFLVFNHCICMVQFLRWCNLCFTAKFNHMVALANILSLEIVIMFVLF